MKRKKRSSSIRSLPLVVRLREQPHRYRWLFYHSSTLGIKDPISNSSHIHSIKKKRLTSLIISSKLSVLLYSFFPPWHSFRSHSKFRSLSIFHLPLQVGFLLLALKLMWVSLFCLWALWGSEKFRPWRGFLDQLASLIISVCFLDWIMVLRKIDEIDD